MWWNPWAWTRSCTSPSSGNGCLRARQPGRGQGAGGDNAPDGRDEQNAPIRSRHRHRALGAVAGFLPRRESISQKDKNEKHKRTKLLDKKCSLYMGFSPTVLSLFLLTVVPTLLLFNISLTSFEIGYPWEDREYIGLDNYVSLFTGKEVEFWPSINLSIFVTIISVVMTLCIGLAVAVLFNRKIKF